VVLLVYFNVCRLVLHGVLRYNLLRYVCLRGVFGTLILVVNASTWFQFNVKFVPKVNIAIGSNLPINLLARLFFLFF